MLGDSGVGGSPLEGAGSLLRRPSSTRSASPRAGGLTPSAARLAPGGCREDRVEGPADEGGRRPEAAAARRLEGVSDRWTVG